MYNEIADHIADTFTRYTNDSPLLFQIFSSDFRSRFPVCGIATPSRIPEMYHKRTKLHGMA